MLLFIVIIQIKRSNNELTVKTKLANYDAVLKCVLLRP